MSSITRRWDVDELNAKKHHLHSWLFLENKKGDRPPFLLVFHLIIDYPDHYVNIEYRESTTSSSTSASG
jgi:hypothetical protein